MARYAKVDPAPFQPSKEKLSLVNVFAVSAVAVKADWLGIVPVPPFALYVTVRTVALGHAVVPSPRMTGAPASVALLLEPPHLARTMNAHSTTVLAAVALLELNQRRM